MDKLEFIIGLPFLSEDGRINGVPYVLPYATGETAFGLVSGWYYWAEEPKIGAEPEGPFNSEREAREDFNSNN